MPGVEVSKDERPRHDTCVYGVGFGLIAAVVFAVINCSLQADAISSRRLIRALGEVVHFFRRGRPLL